jgi:tetratricopeptide (TPR) repeat protein
MGASTRRRMYASNRCRLAWAVRRSGSEAGARLKFVSAYRGLVDWKAGDIEAAERSFRDAVEADRFGKERDDFAQDAARLALVLLRMDRVDEAASVAGLAAEAAPSESVSAQALSRVAVARVTGDAAVARAAADLVPDELPSLRGDVLTELAIVQRRTGDKSGAETAFADAIANYERKGDRAGIALVEADRRGDRYRVYRGDAPSATR